MHLCRLGKYSGVCYFLVTAQRFWRPMSPRWQRRLCFEVIYALAADAATCDSNIEDSSSVMTSTYHLSAIERIRYAMRASSILAASILSCLSILATPSPINLLLANLSIPSTTSIHPLRPAQIVSTSDLWLKASYDSSRKLDPDNLRECIRCLQLTVALHIAQSGDSYIPIHTKIECLIVDVWGGVSLPQPTLVLTWGAVRGGLDAMMELFFPEKRDRPFPSQYSISGLERSTGRTLYGIGYFDSKRNPTRWPLSRSENLGTA